MEPVNVLKCTRLATSVFFTVCGIEKGQACAIERTQRQGVERALTGAVLAQANHHLVDRFLCHNEALRDLDEVEEEPFFEDSRKRSDALSHALETIGSSCTLDELARALNTAPVLNRSTCQGMAFGPRSGIVKIMPSLLS